MNPDETKTKELGQCQDCRFFGFTSTPRRPMGPGPCLRFPPVAIFRPSRTVKDPVTIEDFSQPIVGPRSTCGEFQDKNRSAPPDFTH